MGGGSLRTTFKRVGCMVHITVLNKINLAWGRGSRAGQDRKAEKSRRENKGRRAEKRKREERRREETRPDPYRRRGEARRGEEKRGEEKRESGGEARLGWDTEAK
eukprot:764142-Hanusia_phi.AAC.2